MPIRYAEVTIVLNLEKESYGRAIKRYFGYHSAITEDDTIIIAFDDEVVRNTKDEYVNKEYKFASTKYNNSIFPISFEFGDNRTAYYKRPSIDDRGLPSLNFRKTFGQSVKYAISKQPRPSERNVIYYLNNFQDMVLEVEVFSILHLQSAKETPRFALAYDDTYFDTSDIIYLVRNFFMETFNR